MTKRIDYNQVAPNGVKALGGVYGYVMESGLPAELIDLVYLRVSQINNCAYCLDMHTRDLIKKGVKIEKLAHFRLFDRIFLRTSGQSRSVSGCGQAPLDARIATLCRPYFLMFASHSSDCSHRSSV